MQVVILAGGLGTRLRPLTLTVPKPMVPIHGRPFREYQIDWVRQFGFDRILLLTGYLGRRVEEDFQDGRRWGVSMSYSCEATPRSIHVPNVVSPGKISAIPFAKWISARISDSLQWSQDAGFAFLAWSASQHLILKKVARLCLKTLRWMVDRS
jgi:hypothetical protein